MGSFLKVQGAGRGAGRARLLTLSGFFVFQVAEPEACDEMYESLARLHSNYYKPKVSGHRLLCPQPSEETASKGEGNPIT